MNRQEILTAAADATGRDRHNAYGPAEWSFEAIAELWNFWLEGRIVAGNKITAYDVAQMMSLLKKARARGNPKHVDNYVDDVGYTALAGELAAAGSAERPVPTPENKYDNYAEDTEAQIRQNMEKYSHEKSLDKHYRLR